MSWKSTGLDLARGCGTGMRGRTNRLLASGACATGLPLRNLLNNYITCFYYQSYTSLRSVNEARTSPTQIYLSHVI